MCLREIGCEYAKLLDCLRTRSMVGFFECSHEVLDFNQNLLTSWIIISSLRKLCTIHVVDHENYVLLAVTMKIVLPLGYDSV